MTASPIRSRLVRGARGQVVVTIVLLFSSFASQAGITRRFGLSGLGEYTAATLVVFLASTAAISSIPLATGERLARHLERGDRKAERATAATAGAIALVVAGAAAAVVWLGWDLIGAALHIGDGLGAPLIAFAIVGAAAVGYVPVVFEARLQMMHVGLIAIIQPLTAVVALALDTFSPGVRPAVIAVAGYVAGGTVAMMAFLAAGYRVCFVRSEARPLLRQALHAMPLLYANLLAAWIDRLIVSVLGGPALLGTYHAAAAIIYGAMRLPHSASSFLIAAYARVAVARAARLGDAVATHVRLWTAYAAVLAAVLIAGADGIVSLAYGPGSVAAIAPMQILAVGSIPAIAALSLTTAVTGSGAGHVAVRVSGLTIPLQLLLVSVGVSTFGVIGAALANVVVMAVTFLAYERWSPKHTGLVDRSVRTSLAAGVGIAGIALGIAYLPLHPIARIVGATTIALVGMRMLLFGPEERSIIRDMLLSLSRRADPAHSSGD